MNWKPRRIRDDIIKNLPVGGQTKVAKQNEVTIQHVNQVLHGKRPDNHNIIKDAELLAAINIWKNRFCKFKSEI